MELEKTAAKEEESIIISALSTLSSSKLTDLTDSILSVTHHHRRRISTVLSSPSLFSLTLHHLYSLSLPKKTLLIARHLLSSLQLLTHRHHPPTPIPSSATHINHRDLDAVLLLLLLCDTHHHDLEALKTPICKWRIVLSKIYSNSVLTLNSGGIGVLTVAVLMPFIEIVTRCRRFLTVMGSVGKEGREVAAAAAAVVALPSVEVKGGGLECVICKEEMRKGRDVCELPCQHLFHWMCILPWLRKRDTCPYCRFRLPSDDVFGEIERLWGVLVKMSGGSFDGETQGIV